MYMYILATNQAQVAMIKRKLLLLAIILRSNRTPAALATIFYLNSISEERKEFIYSANPEDETLQFFWRKSHTHFSMLFIVNRIYKSPARQKTAASMNEKNSELTDKKNRIKANDF
jgi:hypothetical protein